MRLLSDLNVWRHVLRSEGTKTEPFGQNKHFYIWRGEAPRKLRGTGVAASWCGGVAAGGTGASLTGRHHEERYVEISWQHLRTVLISVSCSEVLECLRLFLLTVC